jgi:hypothetical protein
VTVESAPPTGEQRGHKAAWLNDDWVIEPPDKIVQHYAPGGEPYLFILAGRVSERLTPRGPFVRDGGTSA